MIKILLNFVLLLFISIIMLTIRNKSNFICKTHNNASVNVQILQKIFKIYSNNLPSSTNLKTLAEQLADQLSGLDPRGWFQSITHNIGSGTVTLVIVLVIIFVVYHCLSIRVVNTKQTQLVRTFFTNIIK